MHKFLDAIHLTEELKSSIDIPVKKHLALLNDVISWVNGYQLLNKKQALQKLKNELDAIEDEEKRFKLFRKELKQIVTQLKRKQERKEKAHQTENANQFNILTADDLCAIYNGIRSIEYMLKVLLSYLETHLVKNKNLTEYLKDYISKISKQKQTATSNMQQRLQIYAEQEEINRKAQAQSHIRREDSLIGSVAEISKVDSSKIDINSSHTSVTNSLIGSFTIIPSELERSYQHLPSTFAPSTGDPLDLSNSQQDTSINKFMCIDVFIYPYFPDKKIGDELNLTVYDYFANQTGDKENSNFYELETINKAFDINKSEENWFSYITGLIYTQSNSNKTNTNADIYSESSLSTSVAKIISPVSLEIKEPLSVSDFYPLSFSNQSPKQNTLTATGFYFFDSKLSYMIEAAISGIDYYLGRQCSHLSFFVKLFDSNRGKKRAEQYKCLFNQLKDHANENEKLKLQLAILTALFMSHDGTTLKQDVFKKISTKKLLSSVNEPTHNIKESLNNVLSYDLDVLQSELKQEIKRILENDINNIKRFNDEFLAPFIKYINNNQKIPDNVLRSLESLLKIQSTVLTRNYNPQINRPS